jgi:hypothetical protein
VASEVQQLTLDRANRGPYEIRNAVDGTRPASGRHDDTLAFQSFTVAQLHCDYPPIARDDRLDTSRVELDFREPARIDQRIDERPVVHVVVSVDHRAAPDAGSERRLELTKFGARQPFDLKPEPFEIADQIGYRRVVVRIGGHHQGPALLVTD